MGPLVVDGQQTLRIISGLAAASRCPRTQLQRIMQAIQERHAHYEWLGLYLLQGEELVLGPYAGAPTDHTRIPVGTGVCGTAIATARNQIIEDVRKLDNYLACSASVRSEIVVLIRDGSRLLGQIDADCDQVGAFDASDEAFLQEVAALIAPLIRAGYP